MIGTSSVQKSYEGVPPFPVRLAERADGMWQKLIETLGCRRHGVSRVEKARERRSDEIPIKVSAIALEGESPREQPVVGVLNTRLAARDSSVGSKPRNRSLSSRPLHLGVRVYRQVNGMWVLPSRKRPGYQPRGESSEGRIPGALPVRNKTGTVSKGVNRQEGNQTLKAEGGERW
jgi:hypothetical protein